MSKWFPRPSRALGAIVSLGDLCALSGETDVQTVIECYMQPSPVTLASEYTAGEWHPQRAALFRTTNAMVVIGRHQVWLHVERGT